MNQKITPEKTLPTILIVDDTPANIGVLSESLEEIGYRILVAQDGEEGLLRAGFVQPDLILLDVMMPGLDGFEVCRRLKKQAGTRDIPVIFMTARTETEDKVAGFKAGGVDYVTKPLQIDEVIARVETQLSLNAMQKRMEAQNAQLLRYREQLEQRVAERTAELGDTNQRLRGEIQERKRLEMQEQVRLRIFERLAQGGGLAEILRLVVQYVEQARPDLLSSIMLLDAEGTHLLSAEAPSLPADYLAAINGVAIGEGIGSCGTAAWRAETVIADDLRTHPYWTPFTELTARAGLLSCWSEPILNSSGKVLGTFGIYRREPGTPDEAEILLVRRASYLAAIAIERIRMQQNLKQALEFTEGVINAIPDLLFEVDAQGRYLNVWTQSPELLAAQKEMLLGNTINQVLAPDAAEKTMLSIKEADENGYSFGKTISIDLPQGRCWFELSVSKKPGEDAASGSFIILSRDITQRKQTEEALIAREREFRTLAENMPDNICRYDHECRLIYMNPLMESTLSLAAREGIGKTPTEAASPEFPYISEYQAQIAKVIASGQPCEIEMTLPDTGHGVSFHQVRFVAERGTQGEVVGVLAIGRDITEIKQAERDLEDSRSQLRGLTARREEAREEERKHIAREVHDELGQILTGLQLNVSVLAYKFAADLPPLREHLQETKILTDKALSVARNVATALRPAALDMGIASSLEWLAERFSANSGIQCKMHIEDSELQLEESHAIALFRIVQESLTNVARYAKASRVDITLNKDEDEYVLQVRDNGKGFDASVKKSDSFGLVGIRERALMLGGECSINSSPGKGTEVLVRIPVRYH